MRFPDSGAAQEITSAAFTETMKEPGPVDALAFDLVVVIVKFLLVHRSWVRQRVKCRTSSIGKDSHRRPRLRHWPRGSCRSNDVIVDSGLSPSGHRRRPRDPQPGGIRGQTQTHVPPGADATVRIRSLLAPTAPAWVTGILGRHAGAVNQVCGRCCWSMKMSARNCSVKVSAHEHTGDTHDEPEGSAAGRRKPRAASNACGRRCRIGWSASSGCRASRPPRRPTPFCRASSPTTTAASRGHLVARRRRGAGRRVISRCSWPVATRARSRRTTPWRWGCAGCSCRPAPDGAAGRAAGSNCANCSMASSWRCTRAGCSPRRRRPPPTSSCGPGARRGRGLTAGAPLQARRHLGAAMGVAGETGLRRVRHSLVPAPAPPRRATPRAAGFPGGVTNCIAPGGTGHFHWTATIARRGERPPLPPTPQRSCARPRP